uniref:Fraser extracellular matrix complex subunit 1 n=1 Tax=Salmo trutta TaxID=8032 RepID=A0A673XCZ9_SALTR
NRDGEEWRPSPCSKCVCDSGLPQCYAAECQPVACQPLDNLVIQPGHCCPQCVPNPCLSAGKEYKHGEQWQKSGCTRCVCDRGQSRCHTQTCPPRTCEKGQTKVKRAGQCCDECVAAKGSCLYELTVRYHGDMWNGTGCEFCTCERGQVLCQRAQCARVECPTVGHAFNLERWSEGPCRECECREGRVTCYLASCPTCPLGMLAVPRQGQCCPECKQVQCQRDCMSCSGSPDHCESCKDSNSLLLDGRCVSICPRGFYANGKVCAACQSSCATCEKDYECSSCGGSLLLNNRQCVATCEPGSYKDHTQCLSCHASCSVCSGPSQQDCVWCSDPSHLLRDGLCVPDCDPGYYTQQGTSCDSSCATCYPDNPKCTSCPQGSAMHHGKCISHCPEQHYIDDHGRCRACHSSCWSCSGPSVSQCTLCSQGLSLHQGQCLEACGEGLYHQEQTCHICHPSCRRCLGPLASDCLRCLKPEEALLPRNTHTHRTTPHGVCVATCPARFYLDALHTCRECHTSCLQCTGGSGQNCTSCTPPYVLLEGQCVLSCPPGFNIQDNTWCHPSCQECSGPSKADCVSCPPLAKFHNGYCTTSCPEGEFLHPQGYCQECNSDCLRCAADLQTGVGSVCLWCKAVRTLLLEDHCVTRCPLGHYPWHGACKRCHASCEGCSGEGPLSCTSCPAPSFLLTSGLCAPTCPLGYYAEGDRRCRACGSQCLSCEMGGVCTSCRDPGKVLMFGECQYDSCAHQYYLNTTIRACRECDWSCNECKGPLRTDCLQCMEGHVLQDGLCTQSCSPGSYQNGERCLSCDEHCEVCHGPGQCGRCQTPYSTLQGHCVLECGRTFFLDSSLKLCTPCSADCVECEGMGRCTVCRQNTYLRDGYCTPDCGHGFYSDKKTRTCHANSQSPTLHISGSLLVPIGGTKPLDSTILSAQDQDSPPESLVFQLLQPPATGRMVVLEGGREIEMSRDDTFSWAQLQSRQVRYTHDKDQAKSGQFTLRVADPQLFSQPETIQVQAVSMQPPQILTNNPLLVDGGETAVISKAVLQIDDPDNPQDVLVMVLDPPQHGRLTRLNGDLALSQFKMEELSREQVQYVHDGSPGQRDRMLLQVNDGNSYQNILMQITITQKLTQAPHVLSVPVTWVREGGMVQLGKRYLRTEYQGSSDDQIIYTIVSSKGSPKYGEVLLVPMPADGPLEGWQPSPDDRSSTPTSSFTQQDVNEGTVWYKHFGTAGLTEGDTFLFQVSSEGSPDTLSDAQTFTIGVMPELPGFPQLAPACDLQITALEDRVTVLTPTALSFVDSETPSEKLVYNITKPLPQGQGSVEHRDRPYNQVSFFSQADVNQGRILYRPPQAPSHLQELYQYSFTGLPESLNLYFTGIYYITSMAYRAIILLLLLSSLSPPPLPLLLSSSFSPPPPLPPLPFLLSPSSSPPPLPLLLSSSSHLPPLLLLSLSSSSPPPPLPLSPLTFLLSSSSPLPPLLLLSTSPHTDDGQLVYEVTAEPKHGFLESKLKPGAPITSFTQADINLGLIRYVLHEESVTETMDNFKFLVKDSKPNVVSDNLFHIQWSLISFQHRSYNVSEKAGTVSVTVKRTGNLNQYAIVLCRTEQGTATSTSSVGSRPGQQDYVEYAGQVQFDEREDTKVCTIVIQDDKVFEGVESFQVELSMPVYALLGQVTHASVNINDTEDEPTLQFDKKIYHVNESTGFIHAPIERKGDTSSTVSALCYTVPKSAKGSSLHGLESGSDYKSRGMTVDSRVIFGPGVSMSTCDVKLIDDSEYELSEEFELHLSDASDNARMGDVKVAKVVIDGPNDASTVSLGNATFTYSEDAGTIEIPVLRQGSDLSSVTSVWCATRPSDPPSATPGVDYIPSSRKVEFKAGKTMETCSLTIMDDIQNPAIEGAEAFVVFLSSPQGAVLLEPFEASVVITDTLDLPSMQFEKTAYKVKEKAGVLNIPIVRTGDLTVKSSVRCFTRTMSAMVMDDFEERRNADDSRIAFLKGEKVKNCTVHINDDSVFEPEEEFQVHLGTPQGDHWSGAMVGVSDIVTVTITNDEDAPTIEFEQTSYQVREPPGPDGIEVLNIKVVRTGDQDRTSKVRCSTRDGSAQSGVDYNPNSRVLKFTPGMDNILFKVEILSNEDREWHESFSLVLGPDDPVEAVLGEITTATVTILDQEAAGSLILPATPIVVSLSDYDNVAEVSKEGSKKQPAPGYPLVCVTPCDPHYSKYSVMRERCNEAGINQTSVHFSWEVAAPTDTNGARSPFETVTDTTPYTGVNHMVLDSIYFSRRFHVRCVAQARDKSGHLGTPLRSNIATIGTEGSICHTPVTTGTARGFQAQSFIASLKYLDVKHKEHPNRIHISVQIPHQDGMLPLVSSMPLHNLHFLLSESIYRQQHICSNLVTLKDLQGVSETGFLDDVQYDSISLGPGYDRPYQFNPSVREAKSIQLYKHLNLKSCIWTFDAYYDMTELIDVCGGSVTADFQVRDSAQSFLTVQVPLYVSYIYVTAPRGWASLEHHTEMEFSFFYDTVLWRTGIQTDSVLSARLQIIRIYIREDGRLVIEFKTHAKFRGQFVPEHHTLPGHKSHLMAPDHLGGIEFDMQLIWSAQSFDSPYQLWKATSSYSRKDYSGEYTVFLIPCTVQPTQPWTDPGDKPLSCTAHAPEKFQLPIAFQQTNRPVPVVYSLNTEFQLCNNEKVFMMDPAVADMSMAEMDYKGAFSMGQTLYGRVLWNPEQNLNSAYKLQLEKVYLCTGRDGYVPFFDPTGTLYNEGPQYGCIQPNKHLKHRFLILDRKQPDICDRYFHDVPFEANFASDITELQTMTAIPGVDGFTMKVDALYKVEAGHQWYLQVIYVIGPDSISGPRIQRSLTYHRARRDLVDHSGRLTLDQSLIYDNEGDQTKNGTNMKTLRLEVPAASTFNHQMGGSVGGGVAALTLLVLVLLASCLLFRKCRRSAGKKPSQMAEEYPLNTKVEVCLERTLEKNFSSKHCTVRNININRNYDNVNSKVNRGAKVNGGAKVKQVNLEVKLHNNLNNDGTEV